MNAKPCQLKFELSNSSEATDRNTFSNSSIINLWEIPWERAVVISFFMLLVLITVIGNTLVILSVLTTRRLRTVTNCYVMNLAVTDWLVGTCVMPPSIMVYILGRWQFGWILCKIWISLDILLCTASILSLCAISLDRYLAVIQPLKYSKKRRSKRLALLMILVVWVVAFLITCPPLFGWYKPDKRNNILVECRYSQNKGYVIFSAMGSFFIPLGVMLFVYLRIGFVLTSRQQRMIRDAVSEKSQVNDTTIQRFRCNHHADVPSEQVALFELGELQRLSSVEGCSRVSCGNGSTQYPATINTRDSCTSFSGSCLSKITEECGKGGKFHNHRTSHQPSLRVPMRISTSKRETKTTKTLTTVMGGFIACWLPFFCYYILLPFLPRELVLEGIMFFFTWTGWLNCAINPFIYAFYNPDFRTAFWRLTFQKLVKKRPAIQQTNINKYVNNC